MRLVCPNCTAQYEVPDDVIPPSGRDVQCSNCSHTWLQDPVAPPLQLGPESSVAHPTTDDTVDVPDVDDEPTASPTVQTDQTSHVDDEFERELDRALENEMSDDEPSVAAAPTTRPARTLDANVASVLREEAEREKRAREASSMETQGELGLEDTPPARPQRRAAGYVDPDLKELDELYHQGANDPSFHRRDLLPDIEEINSTLRGTDKRSPAENVTADATQRKRRNARSGFLFALIVLAIALWVYVYAEVIGANVPALTAPLQEYVAWVDHMRGVINTWMAQAMTWLETQANAARNG